MPKKKVYESPSLLFHSVLFVEMYKATLRWISTGLTSTCRRHIKLSSQFFLSSFGLGWGGFDFTETVPPLIKFLALSRENRFHHSSNGKMISWPRRQNALCSWKVEGARLCMQRWSGKVELTLRGRGVRGSYGLEQKTQAMKCINFSFSLQAKMHQSSNLCSAETMRGELSLINCGSWGVTLRSFLGLHAQINKLSNSINIHHGVDVFMFSNAARSERISMLCERVERVKQ